MADRTSEHPQRYFEDFEPQSEWVHKEKGDIIMIDVSGFEKNQLKVFLETNGKISVSGERPIEGKKWIKFRKEFGKPDNCNVNEIRAKFDCGILYLILPKQKEKQTQNQSQEDKDNDDDDEPKSKPTMSTAEAAAEEPNLSKNAGKEIMEPQTSVNSGPIGGAEKGSDGVVARHAMGLTKLRNLLLILVIAILVLGLGRKLKDEASKFIK